MLISDIWSGAPSQMQWLKVIMWGNTKTMVSTNIPDSALAGSTPQFSYCEIELKISLKHTRHKILGKLKNIRRYFTVSSRWCSVAKSIALQHFFDIYFTRKRENAERIMDDKADDEEQNGEKIPNFSFFGPKLSPFCPHIICFAPKLSLCSPK